MRAYKGLKQPIDIQGDDCMNVRIALESWPVLNRAHCAHSPEGCIAIISLSNLFNEAHSCRSPFRKIDRLPQPVLCKEVFVESFPKSPDKPLSLIRLYTALF